MALILDKYHSLLFSFIIVLGFETALFIYSSFGDNSFIICTVIFFLLFILEALISFQYAKIHIAKLPLPTLAEDVRHIHITHHLVLPIVLYTAVNFFLFFNRYTFQSQLLILISGLTFYTLFEGQRKSIRMGFMINESLHYIYDAIKIVVFYLGLYGIIASHFVFALSDALTFAFIELLTILLFMLVIIRKQFYDMRGILYVILSSVFLAGCILALLTYVQPFTLALIGTIIFYLIIGIMHHKINNSLTLAVISEYIAVAIIILLALKGIS